jgi:hypothetical protein
VIQTLPVAGRFIGSLTLFTFGAGAPFTLWLGSTLTWFERVVLSIAIGTAAAPALADVLGRLHLLAIFPFVVCAAGAVALAAWISERSGGIRENPKSVLAAACLAALALAIGGVIFAHRLTSTPYEVAVYGDYDSVDLTYYSAITGELSHDVPPHAPFHAGHALNYSYHPQLLLATIHRFAGVPILHMYFRYAWPALLAVAALTAFVFIRSIAPCSVALLGTCLILIGGDFSYLAAWWLRPTTYQWDYLLWPTNFLAPTMEVLHFSTWTPALPAMFAGLYALGRHENATPSNSCLVTASFCFAALVASKPFAYAVVIGAMVMALFSARYDRAARRRLVLTLCGSVVLAVPFAFQILRLYGESRSRLRFDMFLLPRIMLDKLDLAEPFNRAAANIAAAGWAHVAAVGLLATPLFFATGLGMRWLGVAEAVRVLAPRRPEQAIWRLLGWIVTVGVLLPFVIVTEPYHDTLQFYQTALFVLWIFTARMVLRPGRVPVGRAALIVLTVALAVPSSLHYVREKSGDGPRHLLARLGPGELRIADYLRGLDPARTVILHDRPLEPSLLSIVSERRTVLAWARYVTGSEARRHDVERFFASDDRSTGADLETLRRYEVTHVVERPGRDRIDPAVLAHLRVVIKALDATLYEVPARIARVSHRSNKVRPDLYRLAEQNGKCRAGSKVRGTIGPLF